MKHILLLILILNFCNLFASDSTSYLLSNRAVSLSIGSQKEYDTYLSPLIYKGVSFSISSERLKYFTPKSQNFSMFSEGVFKIGVVNNPAKTASMIPFLIRYFWGAHNDAGLDILF